MSSATMPASIALSNAGKSGVFSMPSGRWSSRAAKTSTAWTGNGSPPTDAWAKRATRKKGAKDQCVGKNPTDRGKPGVKKSVVVEADGGPLAIAISGANTPDAQLSAVTLNAVVVERPEQSEQAPQHLCLDKGYDNPTGRAAAEEAGYVPHIRRIGEEKPASDGQKTCPARRWVVERTFGWLSRCRGILVRYEKKAGNYIAILKPACALL